MYCLHRCLSVHRRVPHLHTIILPLVPCPFWVVPQWLVLGPFLWGYPSPRWEVIQSDSGQDGIPPGQDWGTAGQVRMGYSQDWGTPSQVRMVYPSGEDRRGISQSGLGYSPPGRTGWGTPPQQNSRVSTWYVAGGMLLRSRRRSVLCLLKLIALPDICKVQFTAWYRLEILRTSRIADCADGCNVPRIRQTQRGNLFVVSHWRCESKWE